jgi:hypothetical protein
LRGKYPSVLIGQVDRVAINPYGPPASNDELDDLQKELPENTPVINGNASNFDETRHNMQLQPGKKNGVVSQGVISRIKSLLPFCKQGN